MNTFETVTVSGRTANLPHRMVFNVSVYWLDGTFGDSGKDLRTAVARPLGDNGPFQVTGVTGVPSDATRADVTFTPDLAAAVGSVDPTPIWGEPIVIRNVKVEVPRLEITLDAGLRAAMGQSIRDVAIVENRSSQLIIRGCVVKPPRRLRTRVSLLVHGVSDDSTIPLGRVECDAGGECPFELHARIGDDSATRATLVFEPDDEPTRPSANLVAQWMGGPIWGESCRLDNLAIKCLP